MGLPVLLLALACRPGGGEVPTDSTPPPVSPVVPHPRIDALLHVWVGDARVTTTDEAAALAGFDGITGDLVVEGTALQTLDLPDLAWVGGSVRVWENDALASVDLTSLEAVAGELSLYDNPALASLQGLQALAEVGGTLSINRNPALTDLRGLGALERVGGDLYLFHDVGLTSLDGLDRLQTVDVGVQLWELYALQDATFPALHTVLGKLDLFECDALTTLSAPSLTTLRAYELHTCDAMTDLGDFPLLEALEGVLTVQYNPALTSVGGFDALREAEDVTLRWNPALASLQGLGALEQAEALVLDHDDGLTSVDLPSLEWVARLVVIGNDALTDPGLPALQTVGEALVIENRALSQCAVDALFDRVPSVGTVQCGDNLDDGCTTWCLGDTGL